MKKIILACVVAVLAACQQTPNTGSFGEKFENTAAIDVASAMQSYQNGKDTTYIIQGSIVNACQGAGCWITLKTEAGEFKLDTKETFVMPHNCQGKKATAKGKFVKDESGTLEFRPVGVIIE